jgi:hypothetical protein
MVVELAVDPPIEESSALMTLVASAEVIVLARVRSSPPFPPLRAL